MRLQDADYTRVILITLPETTPVSEAGALQDDLRRAGIEPYGGSSIRAWPQQAPAIHCFDQG